MKKNGLLALLVLPLMLCMPARTAKADTIGNQKSSLTSQQINKIDDEQQKIIDELKDKLSGLSKSDVKSSANSTATRIIKNNYTELEAAVNNDKLKNTDPNKLTRINNSYVVTPNVSVTFEGSAVLVDVHDEAETTDDVKPFSALLAPTIRLAATSGTHSKHASNTVTCHDYFIKKWVLVTAHIAATFNYNPSKGTCTAHRTSNYMKLGSFTPVLSVINTHSAVQKPSKSRRIAYQDGTISGKITVAGASLGKENYLRVNLECNSHGTIKKSHLFK